MTVLLIHANGMRERMPVAEDPGNLITRTVTSTCGRKVYTKHYQRVEQAEEGLPTYQEFQEQTAA